MSGETPPVKWKDRASYLHLQFLLHVHTGDRRVALYQVVICIQRNPVYILSFTVWITGTRTMRVRFIDLHGFTVCMGPKMATIT